MVKDSGIGIAKENIEKVLKPFGQVADALTRNFDGSGLSLALAKSLVDIHGGELTISSKIGKGTVVTVALPPERTVADAAAETPDPSSS